MSVPVSTKPFGWIFMRCSLWTPREGLDRLVSGSREPSLLSSVLQSLATNCRNCPYLTLACGWGLVHSKWIESQVYKGQYYSFVHLIIFLRMEQQKRNWSVWSTTFLWAGRVYSILSYFSIFFFFETKVSPFRQPTCLLLGEYYLLWKTICYLSSFFMFLFSNLAVSLYAP